MTRPHSPPHCPLTHTRPPPLPPPLPAGFDPARTTVDIGILVAFYFLMVLLALGLFLLRLPRQRGAGGGRARAAASRATSVMSSMLDAARTASGRLLQRGGSARPEALAVPAGVAGALPQTGSKRFVQPAPRGVESAANGGAEVPKGKLPKQLPDAPSTAELLPASATPTSGAEVAVAADAASAPLATGMTRLNS